MFEEADQTESRYRLKPLSAHSDSISLPQEQRSNAFSRVETVFRLRVVQRQEGVSTLQKTRWAICDKKKFDSMIADLTLLIDGLIDLSERLCCNIRIPYHLHTILALSTPISAPSCLGAVCYNSPSIPQIPDS